MTGHVRQGPSQEGQAVPSNRTGRLHGKSGERPRRASEWQPQEGEAGILGLLGILARARLCQQVGQIQFPGVESDWRVSANESHFFFFCNILDIMFYLIFSGYKYSSAVGSLPKT